MEQIQFSEEQKHFINKALDGNNILVDACIGSGKTTTIQKLCDEYPKTKNILYLTYNRLLKIDAKSKIKNKNVTVQNYHGFAYNCLKEIGVSCGQGELIQHFLTDIKDVPNYDVLILDEYQDINTEISNMLDKIVSFNPTIQKIAVGDMKQKIYDHTLLDVEEFIDGFLKKHMVMSFTKCFRLSKKLAEMLGNVWNKEIIGVNSNCEVVEMEVEEIIDFIGKSEPRDILCLGKRNNSQLQTVLNEIELLYPEKYNKKTVYASIRNVDDGNKIRLNKNNAIFTTYDSSKGMERPYCIVFDFDADYWEKRLNNPNSKYEIIRNIFCVAASRGKQKIIFCKNSYPKLTIDILKSDIKRIERNTTSEIISELFDFKYEEDVERCYSDLNVIPLTVNDHNIIEIKNTDGNIDLSPCIGEFQESIFFGEYDINKEFELLKAINKKKYSLTKQEDRNLSVEQKILFLTSLETEQDRYFKQVEIPFVTDEQAEIIKKRLSERLQPNDKTQVKCEIEFTKDLNKTETIIAKGLADVVKDNTVFELKFVDELQHKHYLQCAMYMTCLKQQKGILWNVKKNQIYEIKIPNIKKFLDDVAKTISMHRFDAYFNPNEITREKRESNEDKISRKREQLFREHLEKVSLKNENFAIIDVETTFSNEAMSVGLVIANENYEIVDSAYFVITPEIKEGGMYSDQLRLNSLPYIKDSKEKIIELIQLSLAKYKVTYAFAYNSSFDSKHLKELKIKWYDIISTVAYRQYNPLLKNLDAVEICGTGRVKKYNFETLTRLTIDTNYSETHNALLDALDELGMMGNLKMDIHYFIENSKKNSRQRKKDYVESRNLTLDKEGKFIQSPYNYLEYRKLAFKILRYLDFEEQEISDILEYNLLKYKDGNERTQLNEIIHSIVYDCSLDEIVTNGKMIEFSIKCNSNLKFDKYCLLTNKIQEFTKEENRIKMNIKLKLNCYYEQLDELFFKSYLQWICSNRAEYIYFIQNEFIYEPSERMLFYSTNDKTEYNNFHHLCYDIEGKLKDFGINVQVNLVFERVKMPVKGNWAYKLLKGIKKRLH